jgi:hypothetical protein
VLGYQIEGDLDDLAFSRLSRHPLGAWSHRPFPSPPA